MRVSKQSLTYVKICTTRFLCNIEAFGQFKHAAINIAKMV